jgi:hypothetical protein
MKTVRSSRAIKKYEKQIKTEPSLRVSMGDCIAWFMD